MNAQPWGPGQDAALLDAMRCYNADFAAWSANVQAGEIRLQGEERAAQRAGYRAGRTGVDEPARRAATSAYNARELVAWAVGYGEGRATRELQP
ncbi:MAG TPA: hypothetical protein PLF56_01150 [Micropruina sp.]|jgi:hypothetical protein|nr:hypothetical protein [Micropruina sp.]